MDPLIFYDEAAPSAKLWQLVLPLFIASFFLFPSVFCLFRVFKRTDRMSPSKTLPDAWAMKARILIAAGTVNSSVGFHPIVE